MAEPAGRRMEALRRHLVPPAPPLPPSLPALRPDPSSSVAVLDPSPVIIGGMVLDIHAKPSVPPQPGTTVPGMVKYIRGGVGRNIAECMSKLGTKPFMISVVGNDMAGNYLLNHWRSSGLCTDGILQVNDVATPVVSNTFDRSGELIAGVASVGAVVRYLLHHMSCYLKNTQCSMNTVFPFISYGQEKFLTPSWIHRFCPQISGAPLLMLDANLPSESLEAACIMAYESGVPVFFEPVSAAKGPRIVPIAKYITCATPNEIELIAMANALSPSVKYNFHRPDQCKDKADTVEFLFEMLSPAMFFLLEKGIKLLIVTLGSNGVFICCKRHTNFMNDQRKCKQTPLSTQLLEKLDGCFLYNIPFNLYRESSCGTCVFHLPAISASVVSLVGAGDCLVGGVLSALCGGLDFTQSVAVGIATAKASVESESNIPNSFSAESFSDDARRILLSAKRIW